MNALASLRPESDLLDDFALYAGTLALHPQSKPARRAVMALIRELATRRKAERLMRVAAEADEAARERHGYRADLEG